MGNETIEQITERLLQQTGRGPFHSQEGLYFWQELDGVHVAVAESARQDGPLLRHFVIIRSSWVSAVAATTREGGTGVTRRVLNGLLG